MERMKRECEVDHQKHLKEMDEIDYRPPSPHHILFNPLASNWRSLFTTSLPIIPDHQDFNCFAAHTKSYTDESQRPIQSHGSENRVAFDSTSCLAQSCTSSQSCRGSSSHSPHSTSHLISNRPSHETHLIASDSMYEARLWPVFFLDSQSRKYKRNCFTNESRCIFDISTHETRIFRILLFLGTRRSKWSRYEERTFSQKVHFTDSETNHHIQSPFASCSTCHYSAHLHSEPHHRNSNPVATHPKVSTLNPISPTLHHDYNHLAYTDEAHLLHVNTRKGSWHHYNHHHLVPKKTANSPHARPKSLLIQRSRSSWAAV